MTTQVSLQGPLILSVGGGKGGVGKSMVCSNLAVQYANNGMRVVIVDLDFGAANLHTIFGMRQPATGLGHYFTTPRAQLSDYVLETPIPNLSLIAASGFVPSLANMHHASKAKLVRHIRQLDADIVLLDLGAGSAHNVIDFFSMTQAGIIVTTPEPTSVMNAYEFLKNVVYRILLRMFRKQPEMLEIVQQSMVPDHPSGLSTVSDVIEAIKEINPWIAENIQEVCQDLSFYVVFNQAKSVSDTELGIQLRKISEQYLSLDLHYAGYLYYNEEVPASVYKMTPLSLSAPDSVTTRCLERIGIHILNDALNRLTQGSSLESFEEQLARIQRHAAKDFEDNRVTQLRIARQT